MFTSQKKSHTWFWQGSQSKDLLRSFLSSVNVFSLGRDKTYAHIEIAGLSWSIVMIQTPWRFNRYKPSPRRGLLYVIISSTAAKKLHNAFISSLF